MKVIYKLGLCAITALTLTCATGFVFAQNQGGVQVGGDVNIKAKTGDVTTIAEGDNATAETAIASVTGANTFVNGNVNIDVQTGDVTTSAKGEGAAACSTIGVVGTNACQQARGDN